MLFVKHDITYVNKTIIYFESRTLLNSINIVQINTPIDIANFYIINTFISFFLYLKNINILKVSLKNITNQLIY